MSTKPYFKKTNGSGKTTWPRRRKTQKIMMGGVVIGGGAPITIQTMTKTDTRDAERTTAQILELESIGCDIIRVAVPDKKAANSLSSIKSAIHIPLVADIHFDHKLALMALDAGVDGLRINPGNIGGKAKIKTITKLADSLKTPIRIGINSGSLEKDLLKKHGGATPEALVESAMRNMRILEDLGFGLIKISVKASDTIRTIKAYRLLSKKTHHPLHLGLTEAGTLLNGSIHSAVSMGVLLAEGIGDTIRVSLTDQPEREIRVGLEILRSLGLRTPGPRVVSCPTCGRVEINVIELARLIESELEKLALVFPVKAWPSVAVMGCMVNGPGEAREADIAIAGGKGKAALFIKGKFAVTVKEKDIVAALLDQVKQLLSSSTG